MHVHSRSPNRGHHSGQRSPQQHFGATFGSHVGSVGGWQTDWLERRGGAKPTDTSEACRSSASTLRQRRVASSEADWLWQSPKVPRGASKRAYSHLEVRSSPLCYVRLCSSPKYIMALVLTASVLWADPVITRPDFLKAVRAHLPTVHICAYDDCDIVYEALEFYIRWLLDANVALESKFHAHKTPKVNNPKIIRTMT